MIEKLKKVGIVLTIAILLTVFIFTLTNAIYPRPDYEDFCDERPVPMKLGVDRESCEEIEYPTCEKGQFSYDYDSSGCPVSAECDLCYVELDEAREKYDFVLFVVASISGVLATLFGIFYKKKDEFWMLVRGAAIIGGLASLFIGTGIYYDDMGRFVRPVVIFLELFLVLLVTWWVVSKRK